MFRKLVALALMSGGCIGAVMPPPTAGYGAPYRGTGEPIYVKDSRNDWNMTEGSHPLSSEQTLEATGDQEYEARRQIARTHNAQLYREGEAHRARGNLMLGVGLGVAVVGAVLALVVAPQLRIETTTAATATMPEMRDDKPGAVATGVANLGFLAFVVGTGGSLYGYLGGKRPPPYYPWHTPQALDRPAYVRQQTEPYNEKLGVSSTPGEEPLTGPPGSRRPHPRPQMPPMRPGGAR